MITFLKYEINLPGKTTKGGTFVNKHRVRAVFRTVSFLSLIVIVCLINSYMTYNQSQNDHDTHNSHSHRRLQDKNGTDTTNMNGIFQIEADPKWMLVVYVIGVLYMFLALAIVCDEYFVPALEVMSGEDHLDLTPDIAGATLMAAGGSAPELFTSFIGTFQGSEVGFGTIVGSAVFNVLFVIGMCSLLSKEVLTLTWWPLFRDSTYYAIGLLVLAIFVGVVTPNEITWWEAAILFAMYFGYIALMGFNEKLYKKITGKKLYENEESIPGLSTDPITFLRPTTFRAGLLTLLRQPDVWIDKAKISFVSKMSGSVEDIFDFVDVDGNGEIDREEMMKFFQTLGEKEITEEEVDIIMSDIDRDNGRVSKQEFRVWYIKSEDQVKKQIRKVFDTFDSDQSGSISRNELKALLKEIEPEATSDDYEYAIVQCFHEERSELSFENFIDWYLQSTWFKAHTKGVEEEDAKSVCENLSPPKDAGYFGFLKYIFLLPIVATLTLTVPDVRRPGKTKGCSCYVAFVFSIAWIGIYSYFMVGWAETIGNTLGIDTFILGLTFLAAGTSVPDLLSSVIVARMGEGDMAVSSSIGSNIFDILVGLPVPWLVFSLWPTTEDSVSIGADGVWVSIMILLGMLVLIITSIHCSGWKLTKTLGFMMFFFYFCFLLQAIIRYVLE